MTAAATAAGLVRDPDTPQARASIQIGAFLALARDADRAVTAKYAARGEPAGSPTRVVLADLHATLADRRAAYCLASGAGPDDIQTNGLLTLAASLRRRRTGSLR